MEVTQIASDQALLRGTAERLCLDRRSSQGWLKGCQTTTFGGADRRIEARQLTELESCSDGSYGTKPPWLSPVSEMVEQMNRCSPLTLAILPSPLSSLADVRGLAPWTRFSMYCGSTSVSKLDSWMTTTLRLESEGEF